jgi:hypothetical protein
MKLGTRLAFMLLTLFAVASNARAQQSTTAPPAVHAAGEAVVSSPAALELARAALKAQGGDSFIKLKSLVLTGTADISKPGSVQAIPAKFVIIMAGENCRVELQSPFFSLRQIYDGRQNYMNLPGVNFPPITKFGLNLLSKLDEPGYLVSELPEKKKQKGFRITDPDGNFTDFYTDAASSQVVSYMIQTNYRRKGDKELSLKFAVEHKKMKTVEGVLVPFSFMQRIDTPKGSFFADYKVTDVKVNQPVGSDVFTIPKPR